MEMEAVVVSTRLRRATPFHDAYTVRVSDRRFTSLATSRPADARRWVTTTRWLHAGLLHRGRLVVGLGVQWTAPRLPLHGALPLPCTLQLCVGHRCLVFHIVHADAVPEALRRFLADPRVTFAGSGSANDARMLWAHYGLRVARGAELRAVAGMGNASVEDMARRFLGYAGIRKPRDVAMSAWHAPRLSLDQVQYASVDAYLAFRLGVVVLYPAAKVAAAPLPVLRRAPTPAQQRAPVRPAPPPVQQLAPPPVRAAAPRAFSGMPMPAAGAVHVVADTDDSSDTDEDVCRTVGLRVRAYASDSEQDEDDGDVTGSLGSYDDAVDNGDDEEGYNSVDDQEDEEGDNVHNHQEDGEGYSVDDEEDDGVLIDDNGMDGVAISNLEEEDGGQSEAMLDGGDDALSPDDWYDEEVDYGCDQDDEDEFEEFYLL
ncbi:hypothetical protein U9M48_011346 [Paspalum notatum var. saurae]|uniref:3'-5' exonuclease domain-containing protein n=1 Tax=Paspalum notatum var. saurae TaxID=547442 RepID=A0AAQ3WHD9_PASNO